MLAAPPTPKLELSDLRGAAWLRRGGLEYTRVHTTLVWGLLDPAAFGRARGRREVRALNAFGDVLVAGGGGGLNISSFGRIDATDAKGGGGAAAAPAAAVAGCADYPGVAVPRWKLFSPAALDDAALGRALVWHDPGTSCATRGRRPARTRSRGRATPTATARSRRARRLRPRRTAGRHGPLPVRPRGGDVGDGGRRRRREERGAAGRRPHCRAAAAAAAAAEGGALTESNLLA